jgi:hypothetical protein
MLSINILLDYKGLCVVMVKVHKVGPKVVDQHPFFESPFCFYLKWIGLTIKLVQMIINLTIF